MAPHPLAPDLTKLRAKVSTVSSATAWKHIKDLVTWGGDEALELADEFAAAAGVPSDKLLRFWPKTPDPDGFGEFLLAPAFVREGRTELSLERRTSLTGLRHLTMLRKLWLSECGQLTDLSELAALTELERLSLGEAKAVTDLSPLAGLTALEELALDNCRGVTDLSPLAGLTALTSLDLDGCRGVTDVSVLFGRLPDLRRLDLMSTGVGDLTGFATGFPSLEKLELSYCRSVQDVRPLSGLRNLEELGLMSTRVDSLTGLSGLDSLTRLSLDCPRLKSLDGLDAMPALQQLALYGVKRLKSLDGLGHHTHLVCSIHSSAFGAWGFSPRPNRLVLNGLDDFDGLGIFSGLRELERLEIGSSIGLRDLSGLTDLPSLRFLHFFDLLSLQDFGPVLDLPALEEIKLSNCPAVLPETLADLRRRGLLKS